MLQKKKKEKRENIRYERQYKIEGEWFEFRWSKSILVEERLDWVINGLIMHNETKFCTTTESFIPMNGGTRCKEYNSRWGKGATYGVGAIVFVKTGWWGFF